MGETVKNKFMVRGWGEETRNSNLDMLILRYQLNSQEEVSDRQWHIQL